MTRVQVAVGVVTDSHGRVLIARRPEHSHQGGLWEFPGGKFDPGESAHAALTRELQEELAIQVLASEPLIQIAHDYGDKSVLLDVRRVTAFDGAARGNEGQPIRWVPLTELTQYTFPRANRPIITALTLPDQLLITGAFTNSADFAVRLGRALASGIGLVQLRCPGLDRADLATLARQAQALCLAQGARLQLNVSPEDYGHLGLAAGLHLNRWQLRRCAQRPVPAEVLLGASCHNADEIALAQHLGVDYLCLSPVAPTTSHPEATPLGWAGFAELVRQARVPVYALGGMTPADMVQAKAAGAQGIAGIGFAWDCAPAVVSHPG